MIHPTRCEHGRHWTGGCPECERELLTKHPPPESLRDVVPEAIKSCARCGGPLINGWRIAQYNLPVCESCKIAICGEVVRHKPSATSNTVQDASKPNFPFDLVREWRERVENITRVASQHPPDSPTATHHRTMINIYTRCADELEANPTWKEEMKANP